MKNKIYRSLTAIMIMSAMVYSGGCQKIVESAVVEEKDKSSGGDESKSGQTDEKKSFSGKTVAEQVQAPERYTTTLKTDISPVNRTDKENGMKFTLTADAEVSVPDVDSICLKKTVRSTDESELRDILGKIMQGQTAENIYNPDEGSESGDFTLNGIEYSYLLSGGTNAVLSVDTQNDNGYFVGSEDNNVDQDIIDQQLEYAKKFEQAGGVGGTITEDGALKYLRELLGDNWQIANYETFDRSLKTENGTQKQENVVLEQLVDQIPVTYVNTGWLPIGDVVESDLYKEKQKEAEGTDKFVLFIYADSYVDVHFWNGVMEGFNYRNTTVESNVSDEPLFLLPFEEISAIFEDTIASQIMMDDDWERVNAGYAVENDNGNAVTVYSYRYPSVNAEEVDMTITKVQLGYMNQESETGSEEGTLIPVWDFFGTWTAQDAGNSENGEAETVVMNNPNVPMLTIDARDGSIIQRTSVLQNEILLN